MTFTSCPRFAEVNFLIADGAQVHILCHLLADTKKNLVRYQDCVATFSINRA